MNTLSIDIGVKNLGYTILIDDNEDIFKRTLIFDINSSISEASKKDGNVVGRSFIIKNFLTDTISEHDIKRVIIERQFYANTVAMEIMYTIVGILSTMIYPENIIIFDPKLKFTKLKKTYNSKSKQHKKLSTQYAFNILTKYHPDLISKFTDHEKQDDIADSINMVYISLANNDQLRILSQIVD